MRVAKIFDKHSVALTGGHDWGVMTGDIFTIASEDVIDPETGENLGSYSKLRVKVTAVYPKFCVAETYRIVNRDERPEVSVAVGDPVWAWP